MKKESKKVKVLISILIIMVLLLGGYLIYDKTIKNNNKVESITFSTCEESKTIKDLKGFFLNNLVGKTVFLCKMNA